MYIRSNGGCVLATIITLQFVAIRCGVNGRGVEHPHALVRRIQASCTKLCAKSQPPRRSFDFCPPCSIFCVYLHISRGRWGSRQLSGFSVVIVVVALFVPDVCLVVGCMWYIQKALEKGCLEHPGSACCTDDMFEIFVRYFRISRRVVETVAKGKGNAAVASPLSPMKSPQRQAKLNTRRASAIKLRFEKFCKVSHRPTTASVTPTGAQCGPDN